MRTLTGINPLGAAGADAKALAKTLRETAGFTDDHIQLLVSDGGNQTDPYQYFEWIVTPG